MQRIRLTINDHDIVVPAGTVVAAAILQTQHPAHRTSVSGEARAPFCGMGVCYECRVTIDNEPHRLACLTLCRDGMQVSTT